MGVDRQGGANGGYNFSSMSMNFAIRKHNVTVRYDTRCSFNVRSKADMSQLNLPHGNDNSKV